jgi:hypothetical protein
VKSAGRVWLVGFERGMLVSASSEERSMPRLGEILVRQGYVDREELAAALREQEKHPRHLGQVLEETGKVSHGDIARALSFQIQETALHLFFRNEGEYVFERVPVHYDEAYVTPINTEFLLMEGARRVDEWPAIRRVVQGGNAVFEVVRGITEEQKAALEPSEVAVLAAVDGDRRVSDLVASLGMGLFETCKTLSELAAKRVIERTAEGSTALLDPISGDALPSETQAAAMAASEPVGAATGASHAAPARLPGETPRTLLWMGMGVALLALSLALWLGLGGPAFH